MPSATNAPDASDTAREAWFATTFHHSPIGIIVTRLRDNILLEVNAAWLQLLGYTRDEVVGHTAFDLGLWAEPRDRQRLLAALARHQRVTNIEAELHDKRGQKLHVLISAEQTVLGTESCMLFQIIDITERKRAEIALRASEEQYRGLMESLDSGVAMFDDTGTFLYLNDLAAQQLGGAPGDFVGRSMHELFPLAIAEAQLQDIRMVLREDRRLIKEVQSLVQAQPRWFRTTIQPIHDATGRPSYALVNASDIHDLKLVQEELCELNRTLEERVEQRTAELAQAARAKDEFLAMMSHELRTPLNAVLGITEGMLEEIYGPLTPRQHQALGRVVTGGRHLLGILSDILDLTRIEARVIQLATEPVNVERLCRAAMQLVADRAHKKEIRLLPMVAFGLEGLRADERRLTQILVNLLDNAVKFTPVHGTVGLEVEGNAALEQIAFTVWDTGIGIAAADMERLFQPFTQVDGRLARSYEGIGLGLTLVQRLTALHGGSVQVASLPGVGSRFTVTLPWSEDDNFPSLEPGPARREVRPTWVRPPRVLVAEDHEPTLELYVEQLSRVGCAVTTARTGTAALAQIQAQRPDIVVLDIQMPELDGLSVIQRIRADAVVSATPIIAVTALAMPGDRERCLKAGASAYLAKPVSAGTLVATLEQVRASQSGEAT
jgi:PAS domain S-box-containing protein